MNSYAFKITDTCNKRCDNCCRVEQSKLRNIPYDLFEYKIKQISEYEHMNEFIVYFTGGEPFFYKYKNKNILDLVNIVNMNIPNSKLIIKTSGWEKHDYLNSLLEKVFDSKMNEVRMGFSLFQDGNNHLKRLNNMISIIGTSMNKVVIDVIHNLKNIEETSKILNVLFNTSIFLELLKFKNKSLKFRFKTALSEIHINCAPAYSHDYDEGYCDQEVESICPVLKYNKLAVSYNEDLSFFHCNDPFVDYSLLPINPLESVGKETSFIKQRHEAFLKSITDNNLVFKSKKERCFLCTKMALKEQIYE